MKRAPSHQLSLRLSEAGSKKSAGVHKSILDFGYGGWDLVVHSVQKQEARSQPEFTRYKIKDKSKKIKVEI